MKLINQTTKDAYVLLAVLLLLSSTLTAQHINFEQQISIDTSGAEPHASAMLDISSIDKGVLFPRMTSAQRTDITGTQGLLVYDINTDSFWYHDGSVWTELSTGSSALLDSVALGNGVLLTLTESDAGLLELNDDTGSPGLRLYGEFDNNDAGYIEFFNSEGEQTLFINGDDNHDGGRLVLRDSSGASRIQLNTNFQGSEDARIVTDEIEIRGGSDLAELFDINTDKAKVESGMIVSLDPSQPGKLKICDRAYDKAVVGVVSGANGIKPGILMGQDQTIATGDDLVTLSGRTYIKANLQGGKIEIGDFITSSSIHGEAMRAKNRKKARGAIIGKAMTVLHEESGYVLVLVTLQ